MVGMKAAMRSQDNIISAYRVHGWTYLMGVSPEGVLSELTGIQNQIKYSSQISSSCHQNVFGIETNRISLVNEFMRRFLGKQSGCARGKGGSMHMQV